MNMAEQRVGPQRIKGAYAWRSFLRQGSRIACVLQTWVAGRVVHQSVE
jgi:hypothetical protein